MKMEKMFPSQIRFSGIPDLVHKTKLLEDAMNLKMRMAKEYFNKEGIKFDDLPGGGVAFDLSLLSEKQLATFKGFFDQFVQPVMDLVGAEIITKKNFPKSDWKLIKAILQDALLTSSSESQDAQVAIILSNIEGILAAKG